MKNYEKESIFWYGLHLLAEDQEFKYYISTQKDLIYSLYPLVYFGVMQYSLYRGEKIIEFASENINEITEYIILNLDKLHAANYKYVKEKPKKIVIKDEEQKEQISSIISELLIPYINKNCFKKINEVYELNSTIIRQAIINFAYDINHYSEDGKLKTSILSPFLFTINLIKIYDKKGLYQRVLKYYPQDLLIRKWNSGRDWKEKELDYLQETFELLNNDEEWSLFLSNFSTSKWDKFTLEERYKALFQLTKVTTILMKNEISSVTMLEKGEEVYELIEDYLPLFIDYDRNEKVVNERRQANFSEKTNHIIFVPFMFRDLNIEIMDEYLKSKGDWHTPIDEETFKKMMMIAYKVISKVKILIFTHEYLPKIIDAQIAARKKVFVDILDVFEEVGENKFKPKTDSENFDAGLFHFSEEEIIEIIEKPPVYSKDYFTNQTLIKLAKTCSYLLAIKKYTARTVNYELKELLKYVLFIFGPHPIGHTFLTQELLDKIYHIFDSACSNFAKNVENDTIITTYPQFFNFFELPVRLANWDQTKKTREF